MAILSSIYGVRLTRRESQIFRLITEGLSSKLIAAALSISEYTVANHRKNILRKKGLKTLNELSHATVSYSINNFNDRLLVAGGKTY